MKQWLVTVVLMLASGTGAGAGLEVYRWVDGSGLVHYSDTPPAGGKFTRVRLAASLTKTVDGPVSGPADAQATSTDGAMAKSAGAGAKPADAPSQEASAFDRRN